MGLFDDRCISENEADRVKWLYDNRLERMNMDNRAFIEGVMERIEQYGNKTFFSEKQSDYLVYVEEKYQ